MIELTRDSFDVETKNGKVVVDFWAPWCGPCKMVSPVLDALSAEMKDIKFCKLNVDENQDLAQKYSVRGIPMMLLLEDGEEKGKIVGALPRERLKEKIEEGFK